MLLLGSLPVKANVAVKLGSGIFQSNKNVAVYSLSYRHYTTPFFFQNAEVGYWVDNKKNSKNSYYEQYSLGLRKRISSYWVEGQMGGSIVTGVDQYLSSAFEFTEEISLGYKNIGISMRHYSNAGLSSPNKGRNFILMEYYLDF